MTMQIHKLYDEEKFLIVFAGSLTKGDQFVKRTLFRDNVAELIGHIVPNGLISFHEVRKLTDWGVRQYFSTDPQISPVPVGDIYWRGSGRRYAFDHGGRRLALATLVTESVLQINKSSDEDIERMFLKLKMVAKCDLYRHRRDLGWVLKHLVANYSLQPSPEILAREKKKRNHQGFLDFLRGQSDLFNMLTLRDGWLIPSEEGEKFIENHKLCSEGLIDFWNAVDEGNYDYALSLFNGVKKS